MIARLGLALVAAAIAAGFAVQLHARSLLRASTTQLQHEIGGDHDPSARRQAIADALRVADLRPGTGGLFVATGLAVQGRDFRQAARFALRATKREPDNFSTWVTLGVVRQSSGDVGAAVADYARAERINPLYRTPR